MSRMAVEITENAPEVDSEGRPLPPNPWRLLRSRRHPWLDDAIVVLGASSTVLAVAGKIWDLCVAIIGDT